MLGRNDYQHQIKKISKKKYFKRDQMMFVIFVSNMLMISPHMAFSIPFDLMYDICYPLHVRNHFF